MRVAVLKEDSCQPKKCNDECHAFVHPFETDKSASSLMTKPANHISQKASALVAGFASINAPMMH